MDIYVMNDPDGEKIVQKFYENELQKTNQKEFRIERIIKRKGNINYMLNGKVIVVHLIVG